MTVASRDSLMRSYDVSGENSLGVVGQELGSLCDKGVTPLHVVTPFTGVLSTESLGFT